MSDTSLRKDRRAVLRALGATALAGPLAACASLSGTRNARVVVVGGGYGGATAAKYVRVFSGGRVDVTLVEPNAAFVSCPLSNLVLSGDRDLASLTVPYDALVERHGVRWVRDRAAAIDIGAKQVRLAGGGTLDYDRLILSPGIDFVPGAIPGLANPTAAAQAPHAWRAGMQTLALRHRLEAMPNGGTVAISIPLAPYRCLPAPYERACQVAWYFRRAKPRGKVLVLDGNEDVQSKKALFTRAWADDYKGIVEYRPDCVLTDVDARTRIARFETADDAESDVLNVLPPHGAGRIARSAGVITVNDQWCEVDFLTFESLKVPGIHVLGDAIQTAPLMPKSGHMANQQAKVAAAAVLSLLAGRPVNPAPVLNNACYSYVNDREAAHIASVHQYDAAQKTFVAVPESGGVSAAKSALEGDYGFAWAHAIWADMLG
jgi:NADPH-dependent 2,4-dienoyl-CoA reductase/sulfur reductase-like enzyme